MRKMPQYSEALDKLQFDNENYEIVADAGVKLTSLHINYNSISPVDDYEQELSYWKRMEFEIINPANTCYLQDMVDVESAIYFQVWKGSGSSEFYAIKYNPQYTRWEWWKQGQASVPQTTLGSLFDKFEYKSAMGYFGNTQLRFKWSQQSLLDEDIQRITVFYKNALFGVVTLPVNTNFSI